MRDDDFELFDDLPDHGCQCAGDAPFAELASDPLLLTIATAVLALGPVAPPKAGDEWPAIKRLYEPICRFMLANKAEATDENIVRLVAFSLAGSLIDRVEPDVNPAKVTAWLSRVRNMLVDFRDEP